MRLKKIFRKDLISYLGINYLNTILNVILNLFFIRKLSAYDFGKLSIGKIIFQSYELSHLGIRYAFDQYFPVEKDKAERLSMFYVGLVFTTISSFIFLIFWLFYEPQYIYFYLLFSLSGVMYSIAMLYRIYYRSLEDKKQFVQISFFTNLLPSIAQFLGFFFFGLIGLGCCFLLSYCIILIIIKKQFSIPFIKIQDSFFFILKKLLNKGWLIFLTAILSFLSSSGDRFFIAKYWGLESVGVFSVIMFFFSVFTMFSVNYTEMIMNKIISTKSFKYSLKHIFILLPTISGILFLSYLFLPYILKWFMPAYLEYVNLIQLVFLLVIPFSLRPILNYYLISIERRGTIFLVDVLSTLAYFIVLIHVLSGEKSLYYIVYLKLALYFTCTLLLLLFSCIYNKLVKNKYN